MCILLLTIIIVKISNKNFVDYINLYSYIYISMYIDCLYQKCFDHDCRNFKSKIINLPNELHEELTKIKNDFIKQC